MTRYADDAQNALGDALERSEGDALSLLLKADRNENDGRAIVEMLRGNATALTFIEQRLRRIEDAVNNLQQAYSRETSKLVLTVVAVGICIVVAVLSR